MEGVLIRGILQAGMAQMRLWREAGQTPHLPFMSLTPPYPGLRCPWRRIRLRMEMALLWPGLIM